MYFNWQPGASWIHFSSVVAVSCLIWNLIVSTDTETKDRRLMFDVKNVPVNYAIRVSGPVTPLTRPPRPAWRRSWPICQPEALLDIRARFVAPLFQQLSESPPLPSPAPLSCLRSRRAPLSPLEPLFPTEGYNAASEKNISSRQLAITRWPSRQYCLVDSGSALDNDADDVPGFPGSRRLVHVNCFRCSTTATFLQPRERIHTISLRLHRRHNAASARRLAASPLPRPLPISTTAGLVLGLVLDRRTLRCDMANDENAAYSACVPQRDEHGSWLEQAGTG